MAQRTYFRVPKPNFIPTKINWNTYMNMSIEDLQRAVKTSRQKVRRRLKSLAKAGIKSTPATESLKKKIKTGKVRPFVNSPIPNVSPKNMVKAYQRKEREKRRKYNEQVKSIQKSIEKIEKSKQTEENKKKRQELYNEMRRLERERAREIRRALIYEDIENIRFTDEMKTSTVKGFEDFEQKTVERLGAQYYTMNKKEKNDFWDYYDMVRSKIKEHDLDSDRFQTILLNYVTVQKGEVTDEYLTKMVDLFKKNGWVKKSAVEPKSPFTDLE